MGTRCVRWLGLMAFWLQKYQTIFPTFFVSKSIYLKNELWYDLKSIACSWLIFKGLFCYFATNKGQKPFKILSFYSKKVSYTNDTRLNLHWDSPILIIGNSIFAYACHICHNRQFIIRFPHKMSPTVDIKISFFFFFRSPRFQNYSVCCILFSFSSKNYCQLFTLSENERDGIFFRNSPPTTCSKFVYIPRKTQEDFFQFSFVTATAIPLLTTSRK